MLGKLLDDKKKRLYVLVIMAATIALLTAGMAAASAFSRDGTSAKSGSGTSDAQTEETIQVNGVDINSSGEHAAALFACKVEDVKDSAAIASLLVTMDLESVTGKYAVQIAEKEEGQVMTLTTELPVKQMNEAGFNANMESCVQQMLALIPQLDKVEWIYSVQTSQDSEEQAVASLDDAAAAETLGNDMEYYGKSEKNFRKLLDAQAAESGQQ